MSACDPVEASAVSKRVVRIVAVESVVEAGAGEVLDTTEIGDSPPVPGGVQRRTVIGKRVPVWLLVLKIYICPAAEAGEVGRVVTTATIEHIKAPGVAKRVVRIVAVESVVEAGAGEVLDTSEIGDSPPVPGGVQRRTVFGERVPVW